MEHQFFDELVCDSYAAATGYLGRAEGNKSKEQRYCTLSNVVLGKKLRNAVRLVCEPELGGFLLTQKIALDRMVIMEETVATILLGKNMHEKPPPCSTLEVYNKMPSLITVYTMEYVAKAVT